jgi:hypothetical protein
MMPAPEINRGPVMPKQPLRALALLFLSGSLVEDSVIAVLAWLAPDLWFHLFHRADPVDLDVALLRRAAGQWAAFAVVQAIALWRWRRQPLWLIAVAGARISDLLTDISYLVAVPSLTRLGWMALLPPPFLNAAFIAVMVLAYRQMTAALQTPAMPSPR